MAMQNFLTGSDTVCQHAKGQKKLWHAGMSSSDVSKTKFLRPRLK